MIKVVHIHEALVRPGSAQRWRLVTFELVRDDTPLATFKVWVPADVPYHDLERVARRLLAEALGSFSLEAADPS